MSIYGLKCSYAKGCFGYYLRFIHHTLDIAILGKRLHLPVHNYKVNFKPLVKRYNLKFQSSVRWDSYFPEFENFTDLEHFIDVLPDNSVSPQFVYIEDIFFT